MLGGRDIKPQELASISLTRDVNKNVNITASQITHITLAVAVLYNVSFALYCKGNLIMLLSRLILSWYQNYDFDRVQSEYLDIASEIILWQNLKQSGSTLQNINYDVIEHKNTKHKLP